jgi:glycosyltransferase involved in cell wall biosynthesis
MPNRMPRVSIGVPVYNGEPFLEEALDSILTQTFEDFEVIISDNASTDRTEMICRLYMAKDTRIRYFRNKVNLGAAKNYNRVFELSSGVYFKWAAADDLCAPDFLAKCVAVLDGHPEVILCYPKTSIIDECGNVIGYYDRSLDLRSPRESDRFRRAIRMTAECNAVFGLIRSDILEKTSLIGNYISSDRILLAELSLYGHFYEIPERLFFRRQHARASSSNKSIENQQEFFDPKTKGKICMLGWTLLFQHLLVIRHAPLKPSEKLRSLLGVLRFSLSHRRLLVKDFLDVFRQIGRKIGP